MSTFNFLLAGGIKVYAIQHSDCATQTCSRRDLYRISLVTGSGHVQFREPTMLVKSPALVMSNASTIFSWIASDCAASAFTCVFNQSLIRLEPFHWLRKSNLFSADRPHVYPLTSNQLRFVESAFHSMISAQQSGYAFRRELLMDQVCVLLHHAMHWKPLKGCEEVESMYHTSCELVLDKFQFPSEAKVFYFN